jgi:hypothetical protein
VGGCAGAGQPAGATCWYAHLVLHAAGVARQCIRACSSVAAHPLPQICL